ncbi:TetR/AcrR family transcriptional regulator [Williamsia sp. CHRR-6]|uniref:TetR/AcrR family transcriptional regulator n=1 Tax=Williamsia sp. CHRR-6 TaxID=2835871 RepID=UPI001BDA659E|nr:TetR/AcrR family transcriptional regulator [Williamsia sp. CHRR-6]MBT0568518.1 TetR/AcrR family transcriptional regulator [Williamsia sp. CHRR-6]
MATSTSRQAYLDTGLAVLADLGYGGLKLAEVCRRLGVTSGSFYHFFENWGGYTTELITYWRDEQTTALINEVLSEPDPRQRLWVLRSIGLSLPYRAEGAIRTWSNVDPEVRVIQTEVDAARFAALSDSAFALCGDRARADMFARWSMYLLVGYEQITTADDPAALGWLFYQAQSALENGTIVDLPEPGATEHTPPRRD